MTVSKRAARKMVIRRLLQSPCGRVELDQLLGWTNSPQCIRVLRGRFTIQTTLDQDGRAIYSLPYSEKPKAYQFLKID